MTTARDGTPEQVDLGEMLGRGGEETAVAFHLMNINFHASIIAASKEREHRFMLYDLLMEHLSGLHVAMQEETGQTIEVPTPKLIVPGR